MADPEDTHTIEADGHFTARLLELEAAERIRLGTELAHAKALLEWAYEGIHNDHRKTWRHRVRQMLGRDD